MLTRRKILKSSVGALTTLWLAQGCITPIAPDQASQLSQTPTSRATTTTSSDVKPASTLRVAMPGVPKQLDPAYYTTIEEHQLGFAIYDGLVWVDHTLSAKPMLALEWEADENLRTWTFKLRENVKFHHGTLLSAQDVVHTFGRLTAPDSKSTFANSLSFVEKVEAVDDFTVRFRLNSPSAELPLLLGAPQTRIISHEYTESLLTKQPSGTGPFRFSQFNAEDRASLVRNPDYWDPGHPLIESLEYLFIPYEKQVAALQAGTIDVMMQVGSDDLLILKNDQAISALEVPSGGYQTIVMRATVRPFDNSRVREALKYCVDREAMQAIVLKGQGNLGNDQPVAPISPFYADLPLRPYDPDKARSLLSQSGYGKGLNLALITSTVRPGMKEMAKAFQTMAKPAGVIINVVQVPSSVYWSDYAGRVAFHTGNWGFRASIDETFMVAYLSNSQGNESNWRNPDLDKLISAARGEPNREQRTKLYQQAQKLLMEDGAVIIPYFKPQMMAMRNAIQGFTPHPSGWLDFRTTTIA